MRSPEIKEFILQHSNLFWYRPQDKKVEVSDEFLVETIFNYGDLEAVRKLFNLLGINYVADLFYDSINTSKRRKGNYNEIIINYFTLVFKGMHIEI